MLPRSLQSRLLLTFVTLTAFGLGGVILLTGWQLTAASLDHSKRDLDLQVQTIANALREPIERGSDIGGGRPLDALIASYAQGMNGRVTLLDTQSNVVLSSDPAVSNTGCRESRRVRGGAQWDIGIHDPVGRMAKGKSACSWPHRS